MPDNKERSRVIIPNFSAAEAAFRARAVKHWEDDRVSDDRRAMSRIDSDSPRLRLELSPRYPIKGSREGIELYIEKIPPEHHRFRSLGFQGMGLTFALIGGDLAVLLKFRELSNRPIGHHVETHRYWETDRLRHRLGGHRNLLGLANLGISLEEPFVPDLELRKLLSGEIS